MYPTPSNKSTKLELFLNSHGMTLRQGMEKDLIRKLYNGQH